MMRFRADFSKRYRPGIRKELQRDLSTEQPKETQ